MVTKRSSVLILCAAFCLSLIPMQASAGILFGFGGFGFRGGFGFGRGGFGGSPQSHRYGTGIGGGRYALPRSEVAAWRFRELRRDYFLRLSAWNEVFPGGNANENRYARYYRALRRGQVLPGYNQYAGFQPSFGFGYYGGGPAMLRAPIVQPLTGSQSVSYQTGALQNLGRTSGPRTPATVTQEPRYRLDSKASAQSDLELRRMLAQTYGLSENKKELGSSATTPGANAPAQGILTEARQEERSVWGAVKRGLFGSAG